ncbi:beta-ketoacyl-ACP synthase II [Varunaivibrio sulfuroxidans]|uniref:3-oxoacyl-[acyl-carrier-protein] synthase 2 n=1 Tax=Varunaivibrio sulfuroxidans TaxID=1773489 RepID=A0A4R3J4F5_9PROT|nr:beta-ketoacyl-ACP synthase II [Varunaivibrio sulfuroxidans]TCS60125.1 3-oxoacyl-[acyl-carrier-protein] synthase II [Varunaivibrio sulfuroxidans]WES30902.1 beta-ketoacyl-ACP synthase II [Varunaivibrio sulfuroxidans]
MRRVVITGIGVVSPLGSGARHTWNRLVNAESGIDSITSFNVSDLPAKIAGQVPLGEGVGDFNIDAYVTPKERRRMDDFIVYGLGAASEAVEDAGWTPSDEGELVRTGVMIGSGIGGLPEIADGSLTVDCESGGGVRRLSPFFIPASLINLVSGQVSIKYGFKGPNHAVVTACSTGAHAIGDAARLIMWDDADVMVAGGAEAACCRLGMAGFSQAKALCATYNDQPQKGSRPWDRDRSGFVMGEGAGVVVLEELEHAKARGAQIYAEVVGYGLTGDAYHITAPTPDGDGAYRCMKAAMKRAQMNPEDIDYINAHGTSTMADVIELQAVKRAFGDAVNGLSMSSTKSAIGHLLGAAGAVESVFSVLAIKNGVVPPTLNLDNPDDGCDIDLVPHQAKERPVRAALSNSFGFGGTNASLIFKAFT